MRTGADLIRKLRGPDYINPEIDEMRLFADAIEEADGSFRDLIESECLWIETPGAEVEGDGWWSTLHILDGIGGSFEIAPEHNFNHTINRALSYLDRRGLLIRKEGEPHMVRFVEDAA